MKRLFKSIKKFCCKHSFAIITSDSVNYKQDSLYVCVKCGYKKRQNNKKEK